MRIFVIFVKTKRIKTIFFIIYYYVICFLSFFFFWEAYFILSCHLSIWLRALCPLSLADVLFLCLPLFYCLGPGCRLRWPLSPCLCSVSRSQSRRAVVNLSSFECRGSHQERLWRGENNQTRCLRVCRDKECNNRKIGWIINKLFFECSCPGPEVWRDSCPLVLCDKCCI